MVLNLGRAPSRLAIDAKGLTIVMSWGASLTVAWSEVKEVEYPRSGAWEVRLTTGSSFEIWPFAYTPSERVGIQNAFRTHLGGRTTNGESA